MKERIQLQIKEPCHEKWNAMTPNEQGRHCQSCCKTVVDFSHMTDRELIDYVSYHAHGNTCARMHEGQLNRVIERPRERTASWKYFWTLALSSLMWSYRSVAQVKTNRGVTETADTIKRDTISRQVMMGMYELAPVKIIPVYEVRGRVVDETGAPVPYASVTTKSPDIKVSADADGRFTFRMAQSAKPGWSFSAIGYKTATSRPQITGLVEPVNAAGHVVTMQLKDVVLKKQYKELNEVMVIGYTTVGKVDITGTVTSIVPDTLLTKTQRVMAALMGRTAISVYPNPVPAGGSFDVRFNIKQTGDYNLQLMDASGRIVGGRQLTITGMGQVETFATKELQAHGVYFIRVAGRNDQRVYSTKLLVE